MIADGWQPRGVHLVGSVPLADADTVFRVVAGALGNRLERLPDGETGERGNWIAWQLPALAANDCFEVLAPNPAEYAPNPRVRLRREQRRTPPSLGPLGYAAAARASWTAFARLQAAGVIPPRCRFQVSLPTPLAPVNALVVPPDQAAVEPAYEARLLAELAEIAAAIPAERLAIQWDVCAEMGIWEGQRAAHFPDARAGVIERLVRYAAAVPAGVELGVHLCYGDRDHQHFLEPADTARLVEVANALVASAGRPLAWLHLPVPRDRSDAAYFAPLEGLRLPPATRLYLGLLHLTDGEAGAWARIAAARRYVADFGVATECGFGRRPPETIPALLALHAAVAAPSSE